MYLLPAAPGKVIGIAFKDVGLVTAKDVYITWLKALHGTARYQRALSFNDPGELDFIMAVQMIVEMGQDVFLYND